MNQVILGNVFSLLSTLTDLYSVSRKTAKSMHVAQTVTQALLGFSSLFLGGYSAVVQNVVSIIRNLAALKEKSHKAIEYALIVMGVALGIAFNNLGWIGWLPIVSNFVYSVSVFQFKNDERSLKIAFAVCVALYIVFNFKILNYVGTASNVVVFSTAALSLIRGGRADKKKADHA